MSVIVTGCDPGSPPSIAVADPGDCATDSAGSGYPDYTFGDGTVVKMTICKNNGAACVRQSDAVSSTCKIYQSTLGGVAVSRCVCGQADTSYVPYP